MKKSIHIFLAIFSLVVVHNFSVAQVQKPFSIQYQTTQKGGIVFLSNVSVGCAANPLTAGGACQADVNQVPPAGTYKDNDLDGKYVDIDGDASTFMSSKDSLDLPSCSEISWAGLYWVANGSLSTAGHDKIKIKVNNGAYQSITADSAQAYTVGFNTYHCFKNVTSIVQAAGVKSRFTIADIPFTDQGPNNEFGSWLLVVVYRNDLMGMRQLTVFNGRGNIDQTHSPIDIPISGFLTPLSGPVTIEFGIYVVDGDRGSTGDNLAFKSAGAFIDIIDALNPLNDVMNSTVSNKGVLTPFRVPSLNNTAGLDADIFAPDNSTKNYIGNSATSGTFEMTTSSETYLANVITTAIDVYEPDIRAAVKARDVNGGIVQPGDTIEYTVIGKNIGSDPSIKTFITDTLEQNATFVPGSIIITKGPNLGVKTDGSNDDQAEYIAASRTIQVRIGSGAGATVGGKVLNSPAGIDSTEFKFRITATTDCFKLLCDNVIDNRAFIEGTGNVSGNKFNNASNPGIFDSKGCPIKGTTSTAINAAGCSAPPDTSISMCGGQLFSSIYKRAGYTFRNSTFATVTTATVTGTYYAVHPTYTGCADTVKITITSVSNCDNDKDGIPDDNDLDDDNDGIPDLVEGNGDKDGDGIKDSFDLDSDNDGITDVAEAGGTDANGDGIIDGFVDANGNGLADSVDPTKSGTPLVLKDTDGDGVKNYLDLDSDNDGITDVTEAGGTDANGDGIIDGYTDTNGNGLADNVDPGKSGTPLANKDTDGDGVKNYLDLDSDNDGITDVTEAGGTDANGDGVIDGYADTNGNGLADSVDPGKAGTPLTNKDTDGDGIKNYLDLDSDNDGITDVVEAGGADTNGDGIIDGFADSNGNGLSNSVDTKTAGTALANKDTDGDGIKNYLDLDSDNDGITDVTEAGGTDTNGDGIIDGFADSNGNGLANSVDTKTAGTALANKDTDGDGVKNYLDLDSDNDGLTDIIEAGGTDANGDGIIDVYADTNGNGLADSVDPGKSGTPLANKDSDGDGIKNYLDLDSDNDGITDVTEAGGIDANSDGIIDGFADSNGNGLSNSVDTKTAGTALANKDTDGDGIKNYLDLDSDNDGITDVTEAGGTDTNGDGAIDGFADSDSDGLATSVDPTTSGTPLLVGDFDGDGKKNYLDLDSDNDGILDIIEAGGTDANKDGQVDAFSDTDKDGLANAVDPSNGGTALAKTNTDNSQGPNYLDIDSDNDGIVDNIEGQTTIGYVAPAGTDTDGDGVDNSYDVFVGFGAAGIAAVNTDGADTPDYIDTDSDNDGALDAIEGWDTDNDGVANKIASGTDADKDGLDDGYDANIAAVNPTNGQTPSSFPDLDIPGGDRDWREGGILDNDKDGIPDLTDLDDDNDGIPDLVEGNGDKDGDGIKDSFDLDSDNDGITDVAEAGGIDANGDGLIDGFVDADGNGLADSVDPAKSGTPLVVGDKDGDGVKDYLDLDSDNDGITDVAEAGGTDANGDGIIDGFADANGNGLADSVDPAKSGTPLVTIDTDGDGIKNYLDVDSDNDGITDVAEAGGADANGDGIIDGFADANGNGLADSVDPAKSGTPLVVLDTDGDGIKNYLDLDSDNDGITDVVEAGGTDANGDGIIDGFADSDADGLATSVDPTTSGTPLLVEDFDGDGKKDYLDLDSDNDGIVDITEAGGVDINGDGQVDAFADTDKDGLADTVDANNGGVALPKTNTDNSGNPNYIDIDSDNDGIVDNIEGQSTAGYIAPSGNDTDGDGVDNSYDAFAGFGATGIVPVNTDGADAPDYLDLDSDNDSVTDAIEGWDTDNDGTANVIASGTDIDKDGLDDAYDANTAAVNPTNGQTALSFPDLDIPGGDRDWREAGGGVDTDKDGIPDIVDIDDDNDGILDTKEILTARNGGDTDGDGVPDIIDLDSDNDGIPDFIEAKGNSSLDANNDGMVDGPVGTNGWPDAVDNTAGGTVLLVPDTDGDGRPNFQDLDSDNDGIDDSQESGTTSADADGDGIVDGLDSDADGLIDSVDPDKGGTLVNNPKNTDGDGAPDYLDLDSDNDGIDDVIESGNEAFDTDKNGVVNGTDTDKDGILDPVDGLTTTFGDGPNSFARDTDKDGVPDYRDLDTDNDGIDDVIEGGYVSLDNNKDGVIDGIDTDNDGILDLVDGAMSTFGDGASGAVKPIDTDADGVPDYRDLDSDNDSIDDVIENNNGKFDTNHDGLVDGPDADGDGISDSVDGDKATFGDGPNGSPAPVNTDNDSAPDYQDLDSDDDGVSDILESGSPAFDNNNNGIVDGSSDTDGDGILDPVDGTTAVFGDGPNGAPTPVDTDGDGLPNFQDIDSDGDGTKDGIRNELVDKDCDNDGIPNYLDPDMCVPFIPQGFSPNGDGVHDLFVIDGLEDYPNNKIVIFNRWGNKVYEAAPYYSIWDGTNDFGISIGNVDKNLPVGTYFYILETGISGQKAITGYIYLNR